jgi:hypothetical protein
MIRPTAAPCSGCPGQFDGTIKLVSDVVDQALAGTGSSLVADIVWVRPAALEALAEHRDWLSARLADEAAGYGHQVEMMDSGLHGERGQEVTREQHVALSGDFNVSRQRCRDMGCRCGSLGPLPRYNQLRPVQGSHPPDEPGMRGVAFGAGAERRPVGDEVNVWLARCWSREGDKRPLGVQQHVK